MMCVRPNLSEVSDEQVLAQFLPEAAVRELVSSYGTVQKALLSLATQEVERFAGVGPVKARQLTYVCELAKRLYRASVELPPVIRSPQDVVDRVGDMRTLTQEQIRVLYLSTKSGVLLEKVISQGTINTAVVSPREVFHQAIRVCCASLIIIHNHPSGDPTPSQEDIELTKKMVEAGKVIDIAVLDHIIIGASGYVSLKEKGVI